MNNTFKVSIAAAIISFGLIGSSYTLSRFYLRLEKEKIITVKGFAVKRIHSDKASFSADITVQSESIAKAHAKLQTQIGEVRSYVQDNKAITFKEGNVALRKVYKKNLANKTTNEVEYYELSQEITIHSNEVKAIEGISKKIGALLSKDYQIDIDGPFYYITDLSGIKLDLLAEATGNAYERARLMADNSGGKVGKLVEANQGIFQVTRPDSTETSSYGIYSTSTIEKDIKAVVTLKYLIE